MSVSSIPLIEIVLLGEEFPLVIRTALRSTSSRSASNAMTALLALPFSGGALTLILSTSSSQPAKQSLDEAGTTFTLSVAKMTYPSASMMMPITSRAHI